MRELIDSGEWDVFSGVKLNITVDAEGRHRRWSRWMPLMSDGYELKDGEVVEMANPRSCPPAASVTDDVINEQHELQRGRRGGGLSPLPRQTQRRP